MVSVPLQGASFYSRFPRVEHTPGDIWSGLLCDGTLSPSQVSGIVLTPACDLSNFKVETTTYLPIISLRQYFSTAAVLPQIYKRISGLCQALEIETRDWMKQRYELPLENDVLDLERGLLRLPSKAKSRAEELMAGVELLRAVADRGLSDIPVNTLRQFFGEKQVKEALQKIMKNSYSPDLHFLPQDGLSAEYSAVPAPSVVLFRYPSTISLQLLDNAIDTPAETWSERVLSLEQKIPGASKLKSVRPIKLGTLESRFFADMLTRYVSLMIRLGAPSFDDSSISKMILQVE